MSFFLLLCQHLVFQPLPLRPPEQLNVLALLALVCAAHPRHLGAGAEEIVPVELQHAREGVGERLRLSHNFVGPVGRRVQPG